MRVHSFVPFLGLSLVSLAVADDEPLYHKGAIYVPSSSRRAAAKRDGPSICADLPTKWSYSGCFTDSPSNRVLSGPSYHDDTGMSEESCIEYCDARGYHVAGVEFGRECFCGYSLSSSSASVPETDCNMACTGRPDELCGAGDRLNVFTNGDAAPTALSESNGYTLVGCYSDTASGHTLTNHVPLPGLVRVSDCTSACSSAGFSYAGLKYGDECYCGSQISNGGAPVSDSSCNMACTGDKTTLCGGRDAITLYHSDAPVSQTPGNLPSGWSSKGCYNDDVSHRTLAHQMSLSSNTIEGCIAECQTAGYTIAGVEYGRECFCGSSIDNGATPQSSGCDMACSGNKAEICGGAARINIYQQEESGCNVPGCYNGYGLLREIYASLQECSRQCNADPQCQDFQYSHNEYQPLVCNLFYVPKSQNYAYGYEDDSYCRTYSFYEKTCVV